MAETKDVLARKAICAPLSIACRPSIARKVPRICEPPIAVEPCLALSRLFRRPAPSLAAVPVEDVWVPSTMTSNFLLGLCWI